MKPDIWKPWREGGLYSPVSVCRMTLTLTGSVPGFCINTQVSNSPEVAPSARYQVSAGEFTPMESCPPVRPFQYMARSHMTSPSVACTRVET